MSQVSIIAEHIEITSDVCGGKPHIAGHRIKVQDIVIWHERMGMSPDEIVFQYSSITLSDVYFGSYLILLATYCCCLKSAKIC